MILAPVYLFCCCGYSGIPGVHKNVGLSAFSDFHQLVESITPDKFLCVVIALCKSLLQSQETTITNPIVARPRLLEILHQEPASRIVVIVAPAGYGKTTFANQWAETFANNAVSLSLDAEHNTPNRFLQGLMSALGYQSSECPSLEIALESTARFAAGSDQSVLIVDDYHVIENQEIHQAMSILISNLPANMQLIIASRTTPALPLARLRMSGQVRDITISDLSFTESETNELIGSSSASSLSAKDIKDLATSTDGWIAGIRLAMASAELARPSHTASIFDSWYTRQSLDEFVLEEVLSSLPDDLQDFIIRTAFLPHLHPDMCDYVLEITNSAALLDEASRQLAFIRPASGTSSELTYHRLFAESVNRIAERHCSLADRHVRRLRAAEWQEKHGNWEEAFEQALLAEEWESVIRYIRRICGELRQRDLSASRLHWLRKVPLEHLIVHSDLTRWFVTALLETGYVTEANGILKQVMPVWSSSNDPQSLAYMHITSAFTSILQGNDGEALRSIYASLHYQSMDNHLERLHIWSAIMLLEFHRGNDIIADEAYAQVQYCRQQLPAEQGWIFTHVELTRTNQYALRGELSAAISRYQDQANRQPAAFWHAIPNLQSRMAALYLEQNNLEMAAEMARQVEQGLEIYPQQLWHTEAWLVVARVFDALDDHDKAREAINRARAIQETGGGWTLWLKIMATESWLTLTNPGVFNIPSPGLVVDENKPFRTAFVGEIDPRLARIAHLVNSGESDQARPLIENLIAEAIHTKRWADIVQLAMWQAAIRVETGDEAGALTSLNLALEHGRTGGFVRSFITPGYDLHPFLQDNLSRLDTENATYLQHILEETSRIAAQPKRFADGTFMPGAPGPLSIREMDVLQLLATGISNKRISDALFITERTVKKHVSNILQKLEVPNRTAAVVRARELGIIS